MSKALDGRVALVTGGGQGLGDLYVPIASIRRSVD